MLIPVGKARVMEEMATVRDPRQRATVLRIVGQIGFDFACGNPFTPEVGTYCGPFAFIYYTQDRKLHLDYIYKTGKIKESHTVPAV